MPVLHDLARVSQLALSPGLRDRLDRWDALDKADQDVTAADVRHMAALAGQR